MLHILAWAMLAGMVLPANAQLSDDAIRDILKDRIDVARKSVGIVVGIVDNSGTRVISYGKQREGSGTEVDGDTVFEIGSITKVFTATLLADMAQRGEVQLADPISTYLPRSVKAPVRNGKEITLADLSAQVSGLPRRPSNARSDNPYNPYADYSVQQMYAFLSDFELTRDIGTQYEYSNYGVGLLGHLLALHAGTDYETLVHTRISIPLGLERTLITVPPELQLQLATGYESAGVPGKPWSTPALPGMGALRSSANDMLMFLNANMGKTASPLLQAMKQTHVARHPTLTDGITIGLGWHIDKRNGSEIAWHNGSTGGFRSYIGFDAQAQKGVVVFSNMLVSVDDIGRHILNNRFPLTAFLPPTAFVDELSNRGFEQAVATYQAFHTRDPSFNLTESVVNDWGYRLLTSGRKRDAIEIFKLGVHLKPESSNTYDSLAEAYESDSNYVEAIANYQRVLGLNADNASARRRLSVLSRETGNASKPKVHE